MARVILNEPVEVFWTSIPTFRADVSAPMEWNHEDLRDLLANKFIPLAIVVDVGTRPLGICGRAGRVQDAIGRDNHDLQGRGRVDAVWLWGLLWYCM
jgi:hypothetical protein